MLNYRKVNFVLAMNLAITFLFFQSLFFTVFIIVAWIYICATIFGVFSIKAGYFLKTYCSIKTKERITALTFDDGIDTELTPKILDILAKYNIKATFFIVGKTIDKNLGIVGEILDKNKDILNRIISEGHLVGNHTYKHSPTLTLNGADIIKSELELTHKLIYNITGKQIRFFRPPYGVTNPSVKRAVNQMGYDVIGWSVRSLDTTLAPERVMARIKKKLKPGSIVLLHDNRANTTEHLSEYIDYILSQNYRIVRLDELLGINGYDN
jgi:peptidoglycan/xylan/chitin deacetylase (PgdA/CDA1 family)